MPTKTQTFEILFGGGWATDYGTTVSPDIDQRGKLVVPFLLDAEDLFFELDGGPHKMGGTSKANSTAITSATVVGGVYDYWRQGAAGTPSRRHVVHADTRIIADADDHAYTNVLATGLTSNAVPCYNTFDDLLIISSDSTVDVPKSWDQTTFQNLAGTPPRFSFSVTHKDRVWAAGNYAAPSRLYYSALTNPQDWVGAGSGNIDIDQNDGDMITGLASYKNELWVFKGPNKGSIHRIFGSAPTGSDPFGRKPFIKGLGAAWHNCIFHFGDDLGFVSQFGSVHSLKATASFGDFNEISLSKPIKSWLVTRLNYNRLRYIWAVADPLTNLVYISLSTSGQTSNDTCLLMDYRHYPSEPVRWSRLVSYKLASLGLFVGANNIKSIFGGTNDGFVVQANVAARDINSTSPLVFKATLPFINLSSPILMKTIERVGIGIKPSGSSNSQFCWQNDENDKQCLNFAQGGGAVLGTLILGTSKLTGGLFVNRFLELETGGEFRSLQIQINDGVLSQDLEVHSITLGVSSGAQSTES